MHVKFFFNQIPLILLQKNKDWEYSTISVKTLCKTANLNRFG